MKRYGSRPAIGLLMFAAYALTGGATGWAQGDPAPTIPPGQGGGQADAASDDAVRRPRLPAPEAARRMTPTDWVWLDPQRREVHIDGYVCLRRGLLEMFACGVNTKEHESVVALETRAFVVHTALLAIGAEPGTPARFYSWFYPQDYTVQTAIGGAVGLLVEWRPMFNPPVHIALHAAGAGLASHAFWHSTFSPPQGVEIEITVKWKTADGQWRSARAQQWVRDVHSQQIMTEPWVFAGSGFWKDAQSGKEHYMAEAGDMICVSNFSSAMLDVPIKSTDSDAGRLFESNTDAIPPLGTPIRVILHPK